MDFNNVAQKALDGLRKGHSLRAEGKFEEAIPHYVATADILFQSLSKCAEERSQDEQASPDIQASPQNATLPQSPNNAELGFEQRLEIFLHESEINPNECQVPEDLIGSYNILRDIQDRLFIGKKFPEAFCCKLKPISTYLMFGLPGNGKSMISSTIAVLANRECSAKIYSLNPESIISRWQGESERALKALFKKAKEDRHSVLIIDEADGILSERGSKNETETSERLKNIFLEELEGVKINTSTIIIVASTNKPWRLDSAAWSRFEKRYLIPLPDFNQRVDLFKRLLTSEPMKNNFTSKDYDIFAKKSNSYSTRDIYKVIRVAWSKHLATQKSNSISGMKKSQLEEAFVAVRPSVKDDDVEKLLDFLEKEQHQELEPTKRK